MALACQPDSVGRQVIRFVDQIADLVFQGQRLRGELAGRLRSNQRTRVKFQALLTTGWVSDVISPYSVPFHPIPWITVDYRGLPWNPLNSLLLGHF